MRRKRSRRVKVNINRETPTTAALSNIYRVIREITDDKAVYYSETELKELKNNTQNNFLERGKE